MEVQQCALNDIIYIEDECVRIIIEGSVLMLSHETDISYPKVIGTFGIGHILGFDFIDNGYSLKYDTWLLSKDVTLIKLPT